MQTDVALVDVPLDSSVARLELDHRVARRFRWLVLLELLLALTVGLCVLPLLALVVVFGGGGELILPDLDSVGRRAWVRWRAVHGRVVSASGQVEELPPVALEPDRYDRALVHLLARADEARVTVVERIAGGAPVALWFGGLPLLQAPGMVDAARARRILEDADAQVVSSEAAEAGGARLSLCLAHPQPGRVGAGLALVLLGPVLIWTTGGRERLAGFWSSLHRRPWTHTFTVDLDGLHYDERRGEEVLTHVRIDRTDLRGIVFGPMLGAAPAVATRGPLLRLAGRDTTTELDLPISEAAGSALRDLLLAAAHRLWHAESGPSRVAHCPYCATLYRFEAGAGCPSCGAQPTALHGLAG